MIGLQFDQSDGVAQSPRGVRDWGEAKPPRHTGHLLHAATWPRRTGFEEDEMTTDAPTRKRVEDLSQYGKPLDDIPEEAKKAQERIVMEMIKLKYGRFGRFPFFIRMSC